MDPNILISPITLHIEPDPSVEDQLGIVARVTLTIKTVYGWREVGLVSAGIWGIVHPQDEVGEQFTAFGPIPKDSWILEEDGPDEVRDIVEQLRVIAPSTVAQLGREFADMWTTNDFLYDSWITATRFTREEG